METEILEIEAEIEAERVWEEWIMTRNGIPEIITLHPLTRAELIWGMADVVEHQPQWTENIELT
jgi:hypothetical protein